MKQALGEHWASLGPSVQAHYSLSPFTNQTLRLKGVMESVSHSRLAALLIPFTSFFGALIPYSGKNVAVEVTNHSLPDKPGYYWHRSFFFPGRRPSSFRSVMLFTGDGEVTEFVRFGLGIRIGVSVLNGGVIEKDKGYVWKIKGLTIPLPIKTMIGESYIEEMPISDNEFEMKMTIIHPLLGETFAYNGRFSVVV